MPVNWKDPKAFERLLAAMVAAQEMNVGELTALSSNSSYFQAIVSKWITFSCLSEMLASLYHSRCRSPIISL